jgi:hypothetical protein
MRSRPGHLYFVTHRAILTGAGACVAPLRTDDGPLSDPRVACGGFGSTEVDFLEEIRSARTLLALP